VVVGATATPYGLTSPFFGTVEAIVITLFKPPTKLSVVAAAGAAKTAIAKTTTTAGTNDFHFALDPDTTAISAERMTTSIRFGFRPLRAGPENGFPGSQTCDQETVTPGVP
jgi:hypothetical protein